MLRQSQWMKKARSRLPKAAPEVAAFAAHKCGPLTPEHILVLIALNNGPTQASFVFPFRVAHLTNLKLSTINFITDFFLKKGVLQEDVIGRVKLCRVGA
jgi:hypothetical protein